MRPLSCCTVTSSVTFCSLSSATSSLLADAGRPTTDGLTGEAIAAPGASSALSASLCLSGVADAASGWMALLEPGDALLAGRRSWRCLGPC